jgi:hypothetical protein
LLVKILGAQPIATNAMLDLLAKAIFHGIGFATENGRANLEAANASAREIKRGWKLATERYPDPTEETRTNVSTDRKRVTAN